MLPSLTSTAAVKSVHPSYPVMVESSANRIQPASGYSHQACNIAVNETGDCPSRAENGMIWIGDLAIQELYHDIVGRQRGTSPVSETTGDAVKTAITNSSCR